MFKKTIFATVATAALAFSSGALADVGTLYTVDPQGAGTVLTGQNGDINNPYVLGSVGSFAAASGKLLEVVNGNSVGSSFSDWVTFTVPTLSTGGVSPTVFQFTPALGQFSSFFAGVYAGPAAYPGSCSSNCTSAPALGSLTFTASALGAAVSTGSVTGSFTTAPLAAGNYFLYVGGVSYGSNAAYDLRVQAVPVPEPGAISLLLAGLGVIGFVVSKRRNQSA